MSLLKEILKLFKINIKEHPEVKKTFTVNTPNAFKSIAIGQQVWMAENLHVFNFRNGDPIPIVKSDEEWEKAGKNKQAACCYYQNSAENGQTYGVLYNWYAVKDSRGLAPEGWHIPSDKEWNVLTNYLGGADQGLKASFTNALEFFFTDIDNRTAGAKMKSKEGWSEYEDEIECKACKQWSPQQQAGQQCDACKDTRKLRAQVSGNGTNESGFNGLPGGSRFSNGTFSNIGSNGYWWSSTENYTFDAWYRYLDYNVGNVSRINYFKELGLSVRCLRDSR